MKPLSKSKFNSLNKKDLKEKAINSLRSSFAFEGFEFSDAEIAEMVEEAIEQADAGELIPHKEAISKLKKWH